MANSHSEPLPSEFRTRDGPRPGYSTPIGRADGENKCGGGGVIKLARLGKDPGVMQLVPDRPGQPNPPPPHGEAKTNRTGVPKGSVPTHFIKPLA